MNRLLLFVICLILPYSLFAGYSRVDAKWSPEGYIPTLSVQEHYDQGYQELYKNNWDSALVNFMVIIYHFADSPFYPDALFNAGVCYYFNGDLDLANKQLDRYLELTGQPKHFEKVFDFKYHIAEHYRKGRKKHLFGMEKMPKWASARRDAIKLYDEIIAAMPGKEIAALALFHKAECLKMKREFRDSIDSLQILIRSYPKHQLAVEGFLKISEIYLEQSKLESQNPDLIALAQVNLLRFKKAFPSEDRIDIVSINLLRMKEVYAQSLYDAGKFYERKKKPKASEIYYRDTIEKYPETQAAQKSRKRLNVLAQK